MKAASRVLITGATGFLGSHIVDACLAQADEVQVLARSGSDRSYLQTIPVRVVTGDLLNESALREATRGVEVVYHSAARALEYGSREDFWSANVAGTQRLLEASRRSGVRRFVHVSTPGVVAEDRDMIDVDESAPFPSRFMNRYSESKAAAERWVLGQNGAGITTCALRPRAIWGPRDRTGWMPKLVRKLASGRLPDLWSGRTVRSSLCYCVNAAHACLLAARSEAAAGKAYFITDGAPVDVAAFARELASLFRIAPPRRTVDPRLLEALVTTFETLWRVPWLSDRRSPPLSRYALNAMTRTSTFKIEAAKRDLGYAPLVSHERGVEALRCWVDSIGGVEVFTRNVR